MTEDTLLTELDAMGIEVEFRPLEGTQRGLYFLHSKLVIVREGLTSAQRKCALAHELVHARRYDDGHQTKRVEAKVDREAAKFLISPIDYALAERCFGADARAIARELDVTPAIITAFQSTLQAAA